MCIAEGILDGLRTAVDVQVVVERVARASEGDVLPVVLSNAVVEVEVLIGTKILLVVLHRLCVLQLCQFILPGGVILCIEHVERLGNLLP